MHEQFWADSGPRPSMAVMTQRPKRPMIGQCQRRGMGVPTRDHHAPGVSDDVADTGPSAVAVRRGLHPEHQHHAA
jgi:hypothetical protein